MWVGEVRLRGEGVEEGMPLVHVCSGEHHKREWLKKKKLDMEKGAREE